MEVATQIDLKPLVEAYTFANTPMYLYRRFRSNASLKELAEHTPLEVLISEYNRQTAKETTSLEDVVTAYALLVAITFLEYQQALAAFAVLDLSRLHWGNDIKDIFTSSAKIVNTFKVTVEPPILRDGQIKSTSAQSEVSLTPTPEISIKQE